MLFLILLAISHIIEGEKCDCFGEFTILCDFDEVLLEAPAVHLKFLVLNSSWTASVFLT